MIQTQSLAFAQTRVIATHIANGNFGLVPSWFSVKPTKQLRIDEIYLLVCCQMGTGDKTKDEPKVKAVNRRAVRSHMSSDDLIAALEDVLAA